MEIMDYVDENDIVLGQKTREEIYAELLTHRIVHVFVVNDRGEMALQMRGKECSFKPLHWNMSAGGHVDVGESYKIAALRELKEELGITAPLRFLCKEYYTEDPRGINKFIEVFIARHNGPFHIDEHEVDRVEWKTFAEVRDMIAAGEPFHPGFLYMFERYAEQFISQ